MTQAFSIAEDAKSRALQLLSRPASDALNEILGMSHPAEFVQSLPMDDFFRLVKRIGPDDALPILQSASVEQWQYLLDLDIWRRDLPDTGKTLEWLARLARADAARFSRWVTDDQAGLVSLALIRSADILVKENQDDADVPPGYVTFDGSFYIKPREGDAEAPVMDLLRILARADIASYADLLFSLPGILPAETEEELYRLRSSRLAEYGFPPVEEALAVYAPLSPDALSSGEPPALPGRLLAADERSLVPVSPWSDIGDFPFFSRAMEKIADPVSEDRIRLEFATLCNTIISAGSFADVEDFEHLRRVGRKAAGSINIALEYRFGERADDAARLLATTPLSNVFRVGYGLILKQGLRAKRFVKEGWFASQGKTIHYWGETRASMLAPLLLPRPFFFNPLADAEPRPFERLDDLKSVEKLLSHLEALDRMLSRLTRLTGDEAAQGLPAHETFHPALFNRWAFHLLGKEPSFALLAPGQARAFFRLLRKGEKKPPYRMEAGRKEFLDEFLKSLKTAEQDQQSTLQEALSVVWDEFRVEYENVSAADLRARWSKYLLIAEA